MGNENLHWANKPNFFIVGAPKCGTTSMNFYLKEHPEIYIPDRKEFHYFGSDLAFKHDRTEETYRTYFEGWSDEKIGGEASVWYLYSKLAAKEIHEFNPDSKIIVMLRNPVDMVHAHHSQTMYGGAEPITDFEEALDAEEGRRNGTIPTHPTRPPQLFYYSQVARYTEQIERFVSVFGADKVHVVIFDDLKSDVQRIYRETLEFLGVDSSYEADLSPRNKNQKFRNKSLHYFVTNPPEGLKKGLKKIIPLTFLRGLKVRVKQANTLREPRKEMSRETRLRLIEVYRDEIAKVGDYLGRDFSSWLEIRSQA